MDPTRTCPQCRQPLAADAPDGLCPQCLLDSALQPGDQILYFGNYELIEEVGLGGMGIVWRARQTRLDRIVALKMIRGGFLADADNLKRFQAEAQAAAQLQHPHIVAIHEIGEHDGQHYYSMDFVEGKNLADLCDGQPLPAKQAAELMTTIAGAVQFAHQHGILHRDLKPQNVMIDADGAPHLTDFGLAKRMDRDSALTQTGAVMGSPSYMAPEQAEARHDRVGPHTDVYALGAILYELLTGQPPFKADSAQATLMKAVSEQAAAPRKLNPNAPADLETICLKCLEKSPQRRYPTARDLAEELGRFLKHEPILARSVSASRKVEQWAKRNPIFLAGLAALAFLAVSTIAYWLWQQNQYLIWHAAHQEAARAAGARTAFVQALSWASLVLLEMTLCGSILFNKRLRHLPVSKLLDVQWRAAQPKEPISPRALAVYEVIAMVSILFGLFYLVKLIDAVVWEAYSIGLAGAMTYPLIYCGAMILFLVRRERHVQLFGRDSIAEANRRALALLRGGEEMAAIRLYRERTGCSLHDASAAVVSLASENGIPWRLPPKISAARIARAVAITAAALGLAWCLLPSAWRASALIRIFGGWSVMVAIWIASRFKGFARGFVVIIATMTFLATLFLNGGPGWVFLFSLIGIYAGAAFNKRLHGLR